MQGFALEVKLNRWQCGCRVHVNDACHNPQTMKRENLREAWVGSFAPNLSDALRKWDAAMLTGFSPQSKMSAGEALLVAECAFRFAEKGHNLEATLCHVAQFFSAVQS